MNSRAFTLSLIIAGMAMFMVKSYMDEQKAVFQKEYGNQVSVILAKTNIKEFDIINDRNVVAKSIPRKFKAPGSFSKVEQIQNMIALTPILKGEQITRPRVTHPDGTTGLARQVSPNKRAVSIRVSDDQAVSKLIKPGDRVDVLAQINYGGGRKDLAKVKTILQDVLVLSTGLSITNSLPLVGVKDEGKINKINLNTYTNYNTVTLEVDPYEAQKLIFQIDVLGARPYLSLRNNNDKNPIRIRATRLYDILDDDANAARQYFNNMNRNAPRNRNNRGRGGR